MRTIAGCNDLRGAKDCTGVGATMLLCTAVGNVLSEAATKTLVACLTRKQGTDELCHAKVIEPCAIEAIDGATVLPAVRAACGEIFAKCVIPPDLADAFTLERCRHGLSAARPQSRKAFIDCMKKRCDLRLCIGQLL